ncbi:MAG: hypothetical protein QOI41_334 [Myxococcales bacterium]|nr:hypothetical protein [Myxococcales bacterium]
MLSILTDTVYSAYARYFTHATLVEGTLKGSDVASRCLMVMPRNSPFEHYLLRRMYGESFTRVRVRRIWIPALKRLAKNLPADVDFCIAALPSRWDRTFATLHDFKSPTIVRQVIDLSGDWPDITKRFNKKKREIFNRLTKKNPYEFRISKELADFDHFYRRMYFPHTEKQFGKAAKIDSYETLKTYFQRGFLLLVTEGGVDVGGSLCFFEGDTMVFHRGGVLDGNEEHVNNGAQTSLYFYKIRYAKEQKRARLDLGHSRAFFDDGVYRHKREWGASVTVDDDLKSWLYFFNPKSCRQGASMFRKNPLIVHTGDGLKGYCVVPEDAELSDAEKRDIAKRYDSPGIRGIVFKSHNGRSVVPPADVQPSG